MNIYQQYLLHKLEERELSGNLRALFVSDGLIDFCSNDYLSYARDTELFIAIETAAKEWQLNGSSGSRLISGNFTFTEETEKYLAEFYQSEEALIFNSGYDANLGLLSAVPYAKDLILYDELCHASIIDGVKLSKASSLRFAHNDILDLEKKLRTEADKKYIVIESVYSMDGEFAPLIEIVELAEKYDAAVIVDEAHASGVYGENGAGRVVENHLQGRVFARVHTFGKALGLHGAVIVGSHHLKSFLINFARSFIYTTALPIQSILAMKIAHDKLSLDDYNRKKIRTLINLFKLLIDDKVRLNLISSESPIQSIIVSGNQQCKLLSAKLLHNGIYAKAILAPTVPKGKERIRICLHTHNSDEEIRRLCNVLNAFFHVPE